MNINQTLAKLDAASMTLTAPDARRVIRDEAMSLRVKIKQREQREKLLTALRRVQFPTSNQGQAQIAAINHDLRTCPEVDLADAVQEAERALTMWEGY